MIKIENLSVSFGAAEAVKNVTLEIGAGEILGVVGESGSGKSVTALTLMGLVSETARITSGRISFDKETLLEAGKPYDKALYRKFLGCRMSMVFQEPMTSLNPTKRAGRQVEEMLRLHREAWRPLGSEASGGERKRKGRELPGALTERDKAEGEDIRRRVLEIFRAVGLKDEERVYESFPHQLSGGMRQRVMIAMAAVLRPDLMVCDEPTTALDVTVQNQIIELLREINEKQKNAMLFITHDLNLARRLCHRVAVMKDGRVVETGPTEELFKNPREEYTRKLMEAVPSRMRKYGGIADSFAREYMGERPGEQIRGRGVCGEMEGPGDTERAENTEGPGDAVLEVRDLSVYYQEGSNSLFARNRKKCAVEAATFAIRRGEVLGLVGESGCGKTSLSKAILGMNRDIRGSVVHHSPHPQMIFQDPYGSLNPAKTIGWLLQEPLRARGRREASFRMSEADRRAAAYDMLRKIGLPETYYARKPAQLSGGQRQRVSIGQALITEPGLVIADEPVSALDVTIQAQIMELMQKFREEMGLSYLFISHDINVIYQMSDRIMVMKDGRIIEQGDTETVFHSPKEAYTRLLLSES